MTLEAFSLMCPALNCQLQTKEQGRAAQLPHWHTQPQLCLSRTPSQLSGLKTAPLTIPCFSLVTEQPWSRDLWHCEKSNSSPEGPSPHSGEQGGFPSSVRILLLSPQSWKRSNTAGSSFTQTKPARRCLNQLMPHSFSVINTWQSRGLAFGSPAGELA